MISEGEYHVLDFYTRQATRFCVLNADWDPQLKRLKVREWKSSSAVQKIKICLHFIYLICNTFATLHGGWRLKKVFITKTEIFSIEFEVIYAYLAFGYMFLFVLVMNAACTSHVMVNLHCVLVASCPVNRSKHHSGERSRREIYLKWLRIILVISTIVETSFIAIFEFHYTCATASNWIYSISATLAGSFVLIGISFWFGPIQMYMFLYFAIVNARLQIKNEEIWDRGRVDEMLKSYNAAAIISTMFNQTFCRVIAPAFKFCISLGGMLAILVAIRLSLVGTPGATLLSFGLCIFSLYIFGLLIIAANMTSGIWGISSNFISQIRHGRFVADGLKAYAARLATSLLPLRFSIGGFYYMEKEAKLTLISFLIDGTANMLIAFGK